MRWFQRTMLLVRAMLSMVCAGACGVTDTNRVPVEAVDISPAALQLSAGTSGALDAQVTDADGNVLTDRRIVWASSDAAVATVSDRGVVTAVRQGRADIAATAEGKTGVAVVTVLALPVSRVTVTPANPQIDAGKILTLTARALDANGNILSGRQVSWTSSDTRIVTVDHSGVVRAIRRGSAVVTATVEGKFGTATVVVN